MATGQPEFLVLTSDLMGVGGIQRASRMFVEALTQRWGPEQVHLLNLRDGCRVETTAGAAAGPAVRSFPTPALARAGYLASAVAIARRRRERELVVIAGHLNLGPVAWAASRVSGAPYAIWCYGIEAWGRLSPGGRFSLRRASAVLAISRFTAQRVESAGGLDGRTIRVVPLGVSPELAVKPGRRDGATVVTVARLDPDNAYKGVDVVLRAWPRVLSKVPGAQLVVVGDGADRARLRSQADALDLGWSVRFAGQLSNQDLSELYGRASVLALPSRCSLGSRLEGEGFGLVFVEAGAAGLPVVAGRGGATGEVVADGANGLLVDPRDEGQVADSLVRVLSDPELAGSLGSRGRSRAAQLFSFAGYRDSVSGVMESMLAASGRRRCAESWVL